jgi:lipopolysaccharide assembly outer membrane protein LptD (OstA)
MLVTIALMLPNILFGQQIPDSLTMPSIALPVLDTIAIAAHDSSASRDSAKTPGSPSGIDSVVTYSATDSVVYALSNRTMFMFGQGNIRYKELGLKAERININWNTSLLDAHGIPDTADTTHTKFKGLPDMLDGGTTYHGSVVTYDFKSKKGRIDIGKTEIERGWYYGNEIKKMEDKVLFVEDGMYTTCDLEHPHYYFFSPEMKIIVGNKVVAKPVTFCLADVPIFALPFGIFPTERGRRSGLIAPAYGESANRGRYLSHLGYYWAMNDYMDLSVRGDGYAKGGYVLYSDYRYASRYNFTGGISGSYAKTTFGEVGDPAYANATSFDLHLTHNQEFNPTTHLSVDFTFTSATQGTTYYQQTSNNFNDLLLQNILSNATFTKSWEGATPSSLTLNVHRDQNLQSGAINDVLPSISFSRGQSYPFRSTKRSPSAPLTMFDLIGYTYNGSFENVRNSAPATDISPAVYDQRWGAEHQVGLNASPKLGYITVTPNFSFFSVWYGKSTEKFINANDSLVSREHNVFKTADWYNMGVSVSTKLYGILHPDIWGITGIRHQLTPSLGYTYHPDFSRPKWGYFGQYVDTSGVTQTYSHFEKGIFGGPPIGKAQMLTMSLGNVFEMKTAGDSAGQENKFQLMNVDLAASYNFAADSLRFSEIQSNYRTSIGQWLNIGGSASFNLYKFVQNPSDPFGNGRTVNQFLIKEGKLARLTNFSLSIGTQLSGEKKATTAGPIRSEADSINAAARKGYVGLYDQELPDFSIPWNLGLSWNFSQSQENPYRKSHSSGIAANLGFNLTEFWKITATTSYDIVDRQLAAPQITVYRDLHCWEMNFDWVPTGYNKHFEFTIRLKAPQLQDIKVTRQGSARDVYGQ